MTKKELLNYSANEVRLKANLMTEFIRIYTDEYGLKPNCAPCIFNDTFNLWKYDKKSLRIMKTNNKNTYTLVNTRAIYRTNSGKALGKNSTDEIAIEFLNDKGELVNLNYRKKVFKVLPKGYTEKEPKVEVTEKEPKVEAVRKRGAIKIK